MKTAKLTLLIITFIFFTSAVFAQSVLACTPKLFKKIIVDSNKIEIIVNGKTKYIVNLNREMELQKLDDNGKEISRSKALQASVSPGEEIGEDLKLIEWNENKATFELSYECGMPACEPPILSKCLFTVKGSWDRINK